MLNNNLKIEDVNKILKSIKDFTGKGFDKTIGQSMDDFIKDESNLQKICKYVEANIKYSIPEESYNSLTVNNPRCESWKEMYPNLKERVLVWIAYILKRPSRVNEIKGFNKLFPYRLHNQIVINEIHCIMEDLRGGFEIIAEKKIVNSKEMLEELKDFYEVEYWYELVYPCKTKIICDVLLNPKKAIEQIHFTTIVKD